MDALVGLKSVCDDDFEIVFDVIPSEHISEITGERRNVIAEGLQSTEQQIQLTKEQIEELNAEIDKLTNHADGLDYMVAVVSGVLTGMIDSFFVGETVIDKDKIQKELEKKYHTVNDSAYMHKNKDGKSTSSAFYHRLDDLAHHPTILGLIASILVRYFRLVIFIDGSDGKPHIFLADKTNNQDVLKGELKDLQTAWVSAIFGGICLWLARMAENNYYENNDEEMPEPLKQIVRSIASAPLIIELLKVADTWIGHMMSDVSTSQGIPGVFLSLLKEVSVLPILRDSNLPVIVDSLYREGSLNLSEWGGVIFTAAKKQAMPVLINEALVRGFYFVRRLVSEYKKSDDIKQMDWNKVIPFGSRTVERMMTIASGTFMAVDLADAAIRSGGFNAACLLRVNFVGVGRFALAIVTDVGMGIQKAKKETQRRRAMCELLRLTNVKVYYRYADLMCSQGELYDSEARMHSAEADMWIEVIKTHEAMDELYEQMENTGIIYAEFIENTRQHLEEMADLLTEAETKNPGLIDKIFKGATYE